MPSYSLDYQARGDSNKRGSTAHWWAITLALTAVVLNGTGFAISQFGGETAWVTAFPFFFANVVLTPVLGCGAIACAISSLSNRRGRDAIAWFAVALATASAILALFLVNRSGQAVAGV